MFKKKEKAEMVILTQNTQILFNLTMPCFHSITDIVIHKANYCEGHPEWMVDCLTFMSKFISGRVSPSEIRLLA